MVYCSYLAVAGSTLHEPGTHHVGRHEVGVGVLADSVVDEGNQALQSFREVALWRTGKCQYFIINTVL